MRAIVVSKVGGPEVLVLGEKALPPSPGPGRARVRLHAAGVNYVDVYHRTGRYPLPLPFTPGQEGAGLVEAVGPGVTEVKPGERVVYIGEVGAYAEVADVDAWKLVPIPEKLDFIQAAGALLQGLTARFLAHQTHLIQPGETVLIHAAAGGVGLWLTAMAKERGARVLATVGSKEKAELARGAGADEVILYREVDFAEEVKRLTQGERCDVVYDSVGQSTFMGSLDSLRRRGLMVLYGGASGPVPPFDPLLLTQKGSLVLTRPSSAHYAFDRASTRELAEPVLQGLAEGRYRLRIDRVLPLAEAREAHELLESRGTSGKLVLKIE